MNEALFRALSSLTNDGLHEVKIIFRQSGALLEIKDLESEKVWRADFSGYIHPDDMTTTLLRWGLEALMEKRKA